MSRKVEDEAWARQQIADLPALAGFMLALLVVNFVTVMVWPEFLLLGFAVVGLLIFGGLDELGKTARAKLILKKASEDAA